MQLSMVRHMFEAPGPWASVYLDTSGDDPKARAHIATRWRNVRDDLVAAGCDRNILAAIDDEIMYVRPTTGRSGSAIFASQGEIVSEYRLPTPPERDSADWSTIAHPATLVRNLGEDVHWIRADVSRGGGTVATSEATMTTVPGQWADVIHKVSAGGWSMPRYQRAAETNWDRNSEDVAAVASALASQTDADVIVITGDIRARQLFKERLPRTLDDLVVEVEYESPDHGRPDPVLEEATARAVEVATQARRDATLDRFGAGFSDGHSVRGVGPVTRAARDQRIDTLLLATPAIGRTLWIDADQPTMLGLTKQNLGGAHPVSEPAADALIGAAALASSDVLVVDASVVPDGFGAILRY